MKAEHQREVEDRLRCSGSCRTCRVQACWVASYLALGLRACAGRLAQDMPRRCVCKGASRNCVVRSRNTLQVV